MMTRLRNRWLLLGAVVVLVVSTACAQLAPVAWPQVMGSGPAVLPDVDGAALGAKATAGPDQSAPQARSSAAAAGPAARQTVAVRRGSISQVLALTGHVAGVEEQPIGVQTAATVDTVSVTPGQAVEEGQLLFEAGRKELGKDLEAARARVEVSEVRLAQADAQAQARQRESERQAAIDRSRQQGAVLEAEAGLRRAQAELERVKAGASSADRRAAEADVESARAGLERAKADLARATAGPSDIEVKTAEQQVWTARLALQRAQADFERLKRGADPAELRAAQREVTSAQAAVDRAKLELQRLATGDPLAVASAERDVQRAESALRAAQATRVASGDSNDKSAKTAERNAKIARDASITSAELTLKDARDRLARARQGPAPGEIAVAQRNLQSAREALQAAQERYDEVNKGPNELALSTANQAVESAKTAVESAEAHLQALKAGPPAERTAEAKRALASAELTVRGALDRLAEVNSHPTAAELRDANDRVIVASAALDRARAEPPAPEAGSQDSPSSDSFDRIVLEKTLQQDRTLVTSLEKDYAAASIVAPFAGTVVSVTIRPGDQLEVGRPVVVLARGGAPVVRADLADGDVARLQLGQAARVVIDSAAGGEYDATIAAFEDAAGAAPSARLSVAWSSSTPPPLGASAQVAVTLQQKDDVLLLPQRAIRSSGARRYVELADSTGGASRRTIDVQTGIVSGGDVEILSGLDVGQVVVVGPQLGM